MKPDGDSYRNSVPDILNIGGEILECFHHEQKAIKGKKSHRTFKEPKNNRLICEFDAVGDQM